MSTNNRNLIDDGFRADLVRTAEFCGIFELPALSPPKPFVIPKDTIPFSLRNQTKDYSEFIIFYEHDIRFADLLENTISTSLLTFSVVSSIITFVILLSAILFSSKLVLCNINSSF